MEDEEYLMKCVVDPVKRTFYLYSSEGDKKQVDCDTVDEFMNEQESGRNINFVYSKLPNGSHRVMASIT